MSKRYCLKVPFDSLPPKVVLFRRRNDTCANIYAALPANGVGSKSVERSLNTADRRQAIKEAHRLYDERAIRISKGLPEQEVTLGQIWRQVVRPALADSKNTSNKARGRHWGQTIVPYAGGKQASSLSHAVVVELLVHFVKCSVSRSQRLQEKGKRGSFRVHSNGVSKNTAEKFLSSLRWGLRIAVDQEWLSTSPTWSSSAVIKEANDRLRSAVIYDRQDNRKRLKLHKCEADELREIHRRLVALLGLEALTPALKDPSRPHERFSNPFMSQRKIRSHKVAAHKPFADLDAFEMSEELTRQNTRFRFALTAFLIELVSQTGIRAEELRWLRFKDFQSSGEGVVVIIREDVGKKRFSPEMGKTNARNVVPRNSGELWDSLDRFRREFAYRHNWYPTPETLVFHSPRSGKTEKPLSLAQTFKLALEALGVETMRKGQGDLETNQIFTLTTLRSLYITEMREGGASDRLIAANAGTSVQMISKVYDVLDVREHRATLSIPVRRQNPRQGDRPDQVQRSSRASGYLV